MSETARIKQLAVNQADEAKPPQLQSLLLDVESGLHPFVAANATTRAYALSKQTPIGLVRLPPKLR